MNKFLSATILSTVIVLGQSASSFAAVEEESNIGAIREVKRNSLIDEEFFEKHFRFSYWGDYSGSSLSSFDVASRPSAEGALDNPVKLYNSFTLGYQVRPSMTAYAQPRFNWEYGVGVSALDPRIGVKNSSFLKSGNFNMYANLTIELPFRTSTRDAGKLLAPGSFQVTTYSFPDSRFTIGAESGFRIHVFSKPTYTSPDGSEELLPTPQDTVIGSGVANASGVDTWIYIGPFVSYQVTPWLSASMRWELEAERYRGNGFFVYESVGSNLKTFLNWSGIDGLALSPYIKVSPTSDSGVTADNSAIGMEISGTFF